jgi:hypothetical protein
MKKIAYIVPQEINEIELALKEIKEKGIEKATTPIEEVARDLNITLQLP